MPRAKNPYSVHPSVAMVQKWVAELSERTGRSLEQWLDLIRKSGPGDNQKCQDWLKKEYGMGTNYARWFADRAEGKGKEDGDPKAYLKAAAKYVEAMFAGARAGLRVIYDKLLDLGLKVGKEAKACPCTTIVPLFRNHVFAQIKPATNTRIDMGFALKDTKRTGRLIDTGGFAKKDRITHRIPITSLKEIDAEVKRWLKVAYDMDG